jgi:hypothetical protein
MNDKIRDVTDIQRRHYTESHYDHDIVFVRVKATTYHGLTMEYVASAVCGGDSESGRYEELLRECRQEIEQTCDIELPYNE